MAEQSESIKKPKRATRKEIAASTKKEPVVPKFSISKDIQRIALTSAIVAIVIVFLMGAMGLGGWVTKQDFNNNILLITSNLTAEIKKVERKQASVDSAIQAIPGQVNKAMAQSTDQLNDNISKLADRYNELQNKVNNINKDNPMIANNTTAIANLQEKVRKDMENINNSLTSIEERLTAIEQLPSPSDIESGAIYMDVSGAEVADFDGTNHAISYVQLRLYNDSTVDVEIDDLEFRYWVQATPIPANLQYTKFSYGTHYSEQHNYADTIYVWEYDVRLSNLSMSVKAGKSRTIAMPFEMHSTEVQNLQIYLYPEIELTDYDLD